MILISQSLPRGLARPCLYGLHSPAVSFSLAMVPGVLPIGCGNFPQMRFSLTGTSLCVQVDLALEARHLWQFNFNFRKRRGVRFPLPVYPLVEAGVLVETFEAGESITRYISSPGNRFNSRHGFVMTCSMCLSAAD